MSKSKASRLNDEKKRLRREKARRRLHEQPAARDDQGMNPKIRLMMEARLRRNLGPVRFVTLKKDGLRKMSEVFMEFLAPVTGDIGRSGDEKQDLEAVVGIGRFVWNNGLKPDREWAALLASISVPGGDRHGDVVSAQLDMLRHRRKTQYGNDRRTVVDFEVVDAGDQFRVNVAWAPAPEDMPEVERQNPPLGHVPASTPESEHRPTTQTGDAAARGGAEATKAGLIVRALREVLRLLRRWSQ